MSPEVRTGWGKAAACTLPADAQVVQVGLVGALSDLQQVSHRFHRGLCSGRQCIWHAASAPHAWLTLGIPSPSMHV